MVERVVAGERPFRCSWGGGRSRSAGPSVQALPRWPPGGTNRPLRRGLQRVHAVGAAASHRALPNPGQKPVRGSSGQVRCFPGKRGLGSRNSAHICRCGKRPHGSRNDVPGFPKASEPWAVGLIREGTGHRAERSLQPLGEGGALRAAVWGKGGRGARGGTHTGLGCPQWGAGSQRAPESPLARPEQRASTEWAPQRGVPLTEAARLGGGSSLRVTPR